MLARLPKVAALLLALGAVAILLYQGVLLYVALNGNKWDRTSTEMAATDRLIGSPRLLAYVARRASGPAAASRAIARLSDQTLLADLALSLPEERHRVQAAQRLMDQTQLVRVARSRATSEVRIAAIGRLSSQDVLCDIALHDSAEDVRATALARVDGQAMLGEIVSAGGITAAAALDRLSDQGVLRKLALATRLHADLRAKAMEKLEDQPALTHLAQEDPEPLVRRAAVQHLIDQRLLETIARDDPSSQVRCAAVARLTNRDQLHRVMRSDQDVEVACCAARRLDDQELLKRVARSPRGYHAAVRRAAAERLTDPGVLYAIARDDVDRGVREGAVANLRRIVDDDQAVSDYIRASRVQVRMENADDLARTAKAGSNWFLRAAAVRRLARASWGTSSPRVCEVCPEVARLDSNWLVRLVALSGVTDDGTLERIARDDPRPEVAEEAEKRVRRGVTQGRPPFSPNFNKHYPPPPGTSYPD